MSTPAYTPEELKGKYIYSFVSLCGQRPVLDCVRRQDNNKPFLYDSIEEAQGDQHFDPEWDEVISASKYFERLKIKRKPVNQV